MTGRGAKKQCADNDRSCHFVNRKPWAAVAAICAVVGIVIIVVSSGLAAYRGDVVIEGSIEQHANTLDDHEARLRRLETIASQTSTDVKWIRQHLEHAP